MSLGFGKGLFEWRFHGTVLRFSQAQSCLQGLIEWHGSSGTHVCRSLASFFIVVYLRFEGGVPELLRFLSERGLNAQSSLYGLDEEDNNSES